MRFAYQAAEERASEARRHAQRLLNPESEPGQIINPACKVKVQLEYWMEAEAVGGRNLYGAHALEPLVESYIRANLPEYIAKAVAELQAAAQLLLLESKEHLEQELNRIKALEKANEGK